MRLIKTGNSEPNSIDTPRSPAGYVRRRAYKQLDRLLYRVLQLDAILHERYTTDSENTFDSEKALDLKRKIRKTQRKLDRLYIEIEREEARRAASST